MAAPTDLTWRQFGDVLGEAINAPISSVVYAVDGETARLTFHFTIPSGTIQSYMNDPGRGVIKALFKLLEAARNAQERMNEGKPVGERLAALPAPTTGATTNGTVPITRSIASRAVLSSVTQIDGATA